MSLRLKFGLIILLGVVTAALAYPREDLIFKAVGLKNVKLSVHQGLDLQGGAQLVFQAKLDTTPAANRTAAMDSLIQVMQKRANFGNSSGTSEVVVQRQGSDRVLVQLPGVQNVSDAIDRIGKTANLTFVVANTQNQVADTGLSGKDVQSAVADFDPQTSQPIVRLKMKGGDSTKKFGDVTTAISQSGGRLLTYLDTDLIFGPATVTPILDGNAQLSGNFKDVSEAKVIAG